ncbi:branched-chain amino acid ABC transporter permease [Ramlibacter sp. AN1133]|uniref:branched-chain amino acid ABC transporter permease n=1 Tax=Ramlibacter sp. AN1133 TaxID=3133429 RepID=UPI0030C5B79B
MSGGLVLFLEQALNGLQYGLMLFLLAAGLTIVFGVMDMINLAHGSLYMVGAFLAAWLTQVTGSFWLALPGSVVLTALAAMLLEVTVLRSLYLRDHLSQVLATFALILILNDGVRMVFGTDRPLSVPEGLADPVALPLGLQYPAWRLVIIATGLVLAVVLYLLVQRTRFGALVRAGASNREMSSAMGVDVPTLFTAVFGLGAALCAVAGALLGPLLAVQVGMGETILIPAFVVVVIGGIGSMRGALVGALLVGMVDTLGRTVLQQALRETLPPEWASAAGPALASVAVYVLMAAVLVWRPQGLLPVRGR